MEEIYVEVKVLFKVNNASSHEEAEIVVDDMLTSAYYEDDVVYTTVDSYQILHCES